MRATAALLIASAGLQSGCYNYFPLRRAGLVPSSYLAITLTESGSDELTRILGPNILVVRGRYLALTDRGLALAVESVESRRGDIARWAGETVTVPGEFVREVEERHASPSKTLLLVGISVAGLIVTYEAFGPGAGGGVGGGGPGPRPQ